MFGSHFYHATMRKSVAVFGTLFNNISVIRKDGSGNILNQIKVPLAYGPKQKFLARIENPTNQNASMAIKLPRMSFEITGITLDAASKMAKRSTISEAGTSVSKKNVIKNMVAYDIGMQLSIMAKNQDDGLQILEQILPYFQPEYNVTIRPVDGFDFKQDVPVVLNSASIADEYEGDFTTRRVLVYTLEFTMKMKFYGPTNQENVIREVDVNLNDTAEPEVFYENVTTVPEPVNTAPVTTENFGVTTTIDPLYIPDSMTINSDPTTGTFTVGEKILGTDSVSEATITDITGNVITITDADGYFHQNENITGQTSGAVAIATVITTG